MQVAIQGAKPLIRECFEDAAKRYPGPQRVVLKFTLEGQGLSGRMKDGEVMDSTLQDPWVQACFLDAISDAQFPAPKGRGAVTITYPFSFVPDPDGGTPARR